VRVLFQHEIEFFSNERNKKWDGCCRYFICVHADRGLIAALWTPLAFFSDDRGRPIHKSSLVMICYSPPAMRTLAGGALKGPIKTRKILIATLKRDRQHGSVGFTQESFGVCDF